ncbi:hypothetical protein RZS08_14905, partial [Arthrospira platensis SPKY1]|nr:hypothetical protein [Arthrospira platensis SPKY1]
KMLTSTGSLLFRDMKNDIIPSVKGPTISHCTIIPIAGIKAQAFCITKKSNTTRTAGVQLPDKHFRALARKALVGVRPPKPRWASEAAAFCS